MIIPFLFTMGLCALAHTSNGHAMQMTEVIPLEEKVQERHLSNGVKVYIQENEHPSQSGSFRVVLRSSSRDEVLYTYDGKIESLDQIAHFFDFCKEKASDVGGKAFDGHYYSSSELPDPCMNCPQEMAVVAVGDFPMEEMLKLIENHFGGILLAQKGGIISSPIHVDSDNGITKVALSVSFSNLHRSIRTYGDLKESWKILILQELYQQRLEQCSRGLEEAWIHPHPHFFYPVNGYAYAAAEKSENLLSFMLWQIETIRNEGFSEDEFGVTKRKLINQLQYLSSNTTFPSHAFLASYYADQFSLSDRCLSYAAFLSASAELIEEIQADDLRPHIDAFFADGNRSISVIYPELKMAHGLTQSQIETMILNISSFASSPQEKKSKADDVWMLDAIEISPPLESVVAIEQIAPVQAASSLVVLAKNEEAAEFRFAENIPVLKVAGGALGPTESFYQLPLNDKEKRLIRSIFTTMAEKNIIQLALEKRTMEKKGKKVNHVHPLRFIGYIYANPDLKSCMRKIVKSSFKWDAFVDGFSRRMKEEYANNNLYKHIPGFCQEVGANPDEVARYIDKRDWEGLVKSLM